MSAIAYITDSKMLELHRLNSHKTMNFWRLSSNINFSDFSVGDLVFFLSKDREHMKRKEKGIVGFGRLKKMNVGSIKRMWDGYGVLNGYNTIKEFKEAILKVSKEKRLPSKISSFYLENVCFFQPIYLSECGMKISSNIESYTYLKDDETVLKILDMAKEGADLWSSLLDNSETIEEEKLMFSLASAHRKLGDIPLGERTSKKAYRCLKGYADNTRYDFLPKARNEIFYIDRNKINILFYRDKDVDERYLIGQALLYRKHIDKLYGKDYAISFRTSDSDEELDIDDL